MGDVIDFSTKWEMKERGVESVKHSLSEGLERVGEGDQSVVEIFYDMIEDIRLAGAQLSISTEWNGRALSDEDLDELRAFSRRFLEDARIKILHDAYNASYKGMLRLAAHYNGLSNPWPRPQ